MNIKLQWHIMDIFGLYRNESNLKKKKKECTISAVSVYNYIFIEICHYAKANSTIKGFLNKQNCKL